MFIRDQHMPRERGGSRTGQESRQDSGLAKGAPEQTLPGRGELQGRKAGPWELAVGPSAGLSLLQLGIALGGGLPGTSLSSRFP